MGKKYQVWDKESDVYTPDGSVFTPEEWTNTYKWINQPGAVMILQAGRTNGGICMEYDQWVDFYRQRGCEISDELKADPDACIDVIEAFEDLEQERMMEAAQEPTAEERIAAAMEFQNVMALVDSEV